METIGQRVRNLRYKRGYTRQVEFAPMVSMTQSSLSDVESKNKAFTAVQLMLLCEVLNTTPEYIVYGTETEGGEMYLELKRIFTALSEQERATLLRMARALVPDQANAKLA